MWHEYDFLVHQFVAHLRSVHSTNRATMMEINPNAGKVLVKAADPLAKPGIPLYYTHSKTYMYNDIFFHFWDTVMTPTLENICPWMAVTSKKSLEQLFSLEFDSFVLTSLYFVETYQSIAVFWQLRYIKEIAIPLTIVCMTGQTVQRCHFCLRRHCIL